MPTKNENSVYKAEPVPYIVFESVQARHERNEKRHWIAHILSLVVIAVIVGAFLLYLNQYDFESYEYDYQQDGCGINIIGDRNRGIDNNVSTPFGEETHENEKEWKSER